MKTQISTRILTWLALALLQIGAVQGQPIWTQKADHLGAARYDFAGFSANGKGYIGGGRYAGPFNAISEWQEFNPLMNSWSIVAAMPLPYTGLNAFEVGGYGYVCNGVNDITYNYDTQRYNHLGNNWGTLAAMNYPRLHAASASNGAKGYIIGGYGFMAEPLRDLWEYDPILDSWTERDTLPFAAARYNATAFSIDGNVFLFGGWNDVDYLSDLWKYDTTTMHWTQVSSMPATGRELSLAMVLNGEAYIVGGNTVTGATNEVWKYNAGNDAWTQLANFPGTHAPTGGASFVIGGKGYIVPGNGTSECWEFDLNLVGVAPENGPETRLELYPNPVVGRSTVELPKGFEAPVRMDVLDARGSRVLSLTTNGQRAVIDRGDFPCGMYILLAQDAAGRRAVVRFVVE